MPKAPHTHLRAHSDSHSGMSIQVEQLSKYYGEQCAVDNLSFSVNSGEIVGFLGPNGAGKSTTMKMLTGYVPQSSGRATVCGFDVEKNSLEVRRHIGYLPEHNPLYLDLYVVEYLEFVGRLYGLRKLRTRIASMLERTGLGPEQHKTIRKLSKGYRQRVGLAQAMLNDPDVLILDEPTSGLDPNQLADIRNLIRDLGREKTVMLSTHIMQEVQAICDRVLIINRGQLVADSPTASLAAGVQGRSHMVVTFKERADKDRLAALSGVLQVSDRGQGSWQLELDEQAIAASGARAEEMIFRFAVDQGLTLLGMEKEKRQLEDVFRELTRNTDSTGPQEKADRG
jgi:ABC-2 type transport system ATP-binding protein